MGDRNYHYSCLLYTSIGFAKKPYLRESLDPETIELMSGIKKALDPKNILNPHKVFQS